MEHHINDTEWSLFHAEFIWRVACKSVHAFARNVANKQKTHRLTEMKTWLREYYDDDDDDGDNDK